MSGPDFHTSRRRTARRDRPVPPRWGVGSNFWLMSLMGIGFVTALAGFHRLPGGVIVDVSPASEILFVRSEASMKRDALSARFGFCHAGGGRDCVVDGDTFWFAGEAYRIADIDTPETHPARCVEEAALGGAATDRLHIWLNDGPFSLESAGRDMDRYGRKLRIVTRDGTSVGSVLADEGLARSWEGRRRPWC